MNGLLAAALVISMFPGSLRAEPRNAFVSIPGGLGRFASGPVRWRSGDWLTAAGASLGVAWAFQHDEGLRREVQGARSTGRDEFWKGVTTLGNAEIPALFAAMGMTLGRGQFQDSSATALQALAITGVTILVLKPALGSIRPDADAADGSIDRRFFDYSDGSFGHKSFPSGHAMTAFSVAEVYGDAYGRWWTYPLAAMIAYSRVYLDRHWTSDIFAGAALGIAAGQAALNESKEKGPASLWWGLSQRQGQPVVSASLRF